MVCCQGPWTALCKGPHLRLKGCRLSSAVITMWMSHLSHVHVCNSLFIKKLSFMRGLLLLCSCQCHELLRAKLQGMMHVCVSVWCMYTYMYSALKLHTFTMYAFIYMYVLDFHLPFHNSWIGPAMSSSIQAIFKSTTGLV